MADHSAIEWTDATWTIVQGCDPVSEGCVHCYAVRLLWRMMHHPDPKISGPLQGLVEKHINAAGEEIYRFTGKLALREDRLDWPLKWKRPRMIFVPSHGDIFHKDVPDEFIDKIFAVMALCPQHTFQVLTKRAERMRAYFAHPQLFARLAKAIRTQADISDPIQNTYAFIITGTLAYGGSHWPLPNVWLGVSAERQQEADERVPLLLQTPAAIRFVSLEPLLGPINLNNVIMDGVVPISAIRGDAYTLGGLRARRWAPLDWVIAGGESGPHARPMHPDWARSLRNQCETAGVAFFFKQWGEWAPGEWTGSGDPGFFDPSDKRIIVPDLSNHDAWMSRVHWFDRSLEPDGLGALRLGKKAAGRLLDGKEHNGMPTDDSRGNVVGVIRS